MRLLTCILLATLLLPAVLLSAKDNGQPYRTWTSSAGTSVEAQFISRSSTDSITLKRKDGSTLKVELGQLSETDQKHLKELAALVGRPERILFIGNSYTRQISGMVRQIVAASPYKDCQLSFINPGGKTLKWHLENEGTMNKIRNGDWDVVVLQDQSQTPAIAPEQSIDSAQGIDRIIDAIGARTVFFETWGRRDGDKMNAHLFPTYEKMQAALSDTYAKAARKCDGEVVPVGQAWEILRKEHPELGIKLYKGDGSHPARPGAYLAACVFYATLFDADPTALNFDHGLPEDEVKAIQAAVLEVIQ
ncbi:MAG: SGNH/GDSL hydrolase family protein [Opitutales bacterium]